MSRPLQAIVFDFDGVLANSEPLHLRAFQETLAEEDIALSAAEYYQRYLGFDDVGMFQALASDRGIAMSDGRVAGLVARKGIKLQAMLQSGSVLFPGAVDFVRAAAAAVPVAIASGALRHEIDEILEHAGVRSLFTVVVAAGDTPVGKPSPAPYLLAFRLLQEHSGADLDAKRCVAIEDSQWGLESAVRAGLRCVGVTSSYPADELIGAELVVNAVNALTLDALDELCGRGSREANA